MKTITREEVETAYHTMRTLKRKPSETGTGRKGNRAKASIVQSIRLLIMIKTTSYLAPIRLKLSCDVPIRCLRTVLSASPATIRCCHSSFSRYGSSSKVDVPL